jgi:hypothetical protein
MMLKICAMRQALNSKAARLAHTSDSSTALASRAAGIQRCKRSRPTFLLAGFFCEVALL